MALSNGAIWGGVAGAAAGATVGLVVGRQIGAGTRDNPWPELLAILGALAGGVILASVGNAADQNLTVSRTTVNNGTVIPPPGA